MTIVVPAYISPTRHTIEWSRLIQASHQLGDRLIVIANRDSGPGAEKYSNLEDQLNALNPETKVFGYVTIENGAKELDIVDLEIKNWKNRYGVDGIFYDEADFSGSFPQSYVNGLLQQKTNHRLERLIFNPGTMPEPAFWQGNNALFCPSEQEAQRYINNQSVNGLSMTQKQRSFILSHQASIRQSPDNRPVDAYNWLEVYNKIKSDGFRMFYLTNDQMPNPWDSLPPFFEYLVNRISD